MVEAEKVQHGGVRVVHVQAAADRSVGVAGLGSATSEPSGKAAWFVVPSVFSLGEWRAAKFVAPPDDGVFQQPALFEVLEENRDRLIGSLGMDLVLGHVGPTWGSPIHQRSSLK